MMKSCRTYIKSHFMLVNLRAQQHTSKFVTLAYQSLNL
ncbi:hypothetical protein Leryth_019959 [Lithospermum erythrorhizon]|nr:hypothetical protein Leryth_019959 [Lithospermum erythrorhizon]